MPNAKIISEEPMSLVELKQEVKRIKKRDKEPSFRVTKLEEYLNSFVELSVKDYKEAYEKLDKLSVPRLKDVHIKKMLDILPMNVDQLKVVLQGYSVTVSQDNMKKMMGVLKEYLPENKS